MNTQPLSSFVIEKEIKFTESQIAIASRNVKNFDDARKALKNIEELLLKKVIYLMLQEKIDNLS